MKFLHTGDLHLGKKVSSEYDAVLSERIRADERQLLLNIILFANENEIPYIFIAGDLFDSNKPGAELVSFVTSCFERYNGRIFVVCGNHDYYTDDSVYGNTEFPANTYIFKESITFVETDELIIYGCGFTAPHKNINDFSGFSKKDTEKPGVMIIHTDFENDSLYNPVNISDIDRCGLSYIAAGHIHIKGTAKKRGKTIVNYCGAPQNLNFGETGEATVTIGEISEGSLMLTEESLYCHSYRNLSVDISECGSNEEFCSLLKDVVMKEDPENSLIHINITGSVAGFEPDVAYAVQSLSEICMYIRIEENYVRKYDIDLLKNENSLKGEFVRQVLLLYGERDLKFIEKVVEKGMKYL